MKSDGAGEWGKNQNKINASKNDRKKKSCKEEGKEKNSCIRKSLI